MARTKTWPDLRPASTGKRPVPIPPGFYADLDQVCARPLNEESMILAPTDGWSFNEQGKYDEEAYDASRTHSDMSRCWQATLAYERFGGIQHPNLLRCVFEDNNGVLLHKCFHFHVTEADRDGRFLSRDPWTAFPILETPPGMPLCKFLKKNKQSMYSTPLDTLSTRVLPEYHHVIYKWALDLITALAFVHSEDIVFGTLGQENCWISMEKPEPIPEDSSLSVFGFIDAGFKNKPEEKSVDARALRGFIGWMPGRGGYSYPGDWDRSPYHYWSVRKRDYGPTKQTDLYLYGCVLYELMVGIESGTPFQRDVAEKIKARESPALEAEYMGDIVLKCWKEEFKSADEVKAEVERYIQMHQES